MYTMRDISTLPIPIYTTLRDTHIIHEGHLTTINLCVPNPNIKVINVPDMRDIKSYHKGHQVAIRDT